MALDASSNAVFLYSRCLPHVDGYIVQVIQHIHADFGGKFAHSRFTEDDLGWPFFTSLSHYSPKTFQLAIEKTPKSLKPNPTGELALPNHHRAPSFGLQ